MKFFYFYILIYEKDMYFKFKNYFIKYLLLSSKLADEAKSIY